VERVKIAIYTASLRAGGVERFTVNLSAELVRRGYPVDLVLASAEGPLLAQAPPGARIINLKARRVSTSLPGLVGYLRAEHPAALLTLQTHCNLIAILATRLMSRPPRLIVSERNALHPRLARPSLRFNREALLLRLTPYLYPGAHAIVAVSEAVAEELRQLTGLDRSRIAVVYNAVVSDEQISMAGMPVDHPWFAPGQPPVILNVGRLVPQKDQATLLRAFAQLRQRRSVRLLILGEGPERGALLSLASQLGIEPAFSLPGFESNPYRFMRRCGAFVLSSAWEGLSNALVEAMACGASVVSTDGQSGSSEVLENGRYGRLVPVGDEAALAHAIEETLDSPTPPEMLRERAAAFGVARSADSYLKILLPGAA
jgi:glycosyltransferase involved in cell wall biosynthesis